MQQQPRRARAARPRCRRAHRRGSDGRSTADARATGGVRPVSGSSHRWLAWRSGRSRFTRQRVLAGLAGAHRSSAAAGGPVGDERRVDQRPGVATPAAVRRRSPRSACRTLPRGEGIAERALHGGAARHQHQAAGGHVEPVHDQRIGPARLRAGAEAVLLVLAAAGHAQQAGGLVEHEQVGSSWITASAVIGGESRSAWGRGYPRPRCPSRRRLAEFFRSHARAALHADVDRAAVRHRGQPDADGRDRLAHVRPDRQRLGPGAGRALPVRAGAAAGAAGRPRGRPPPPRPHRRSLLRGAGRWWRWRCCSPCMAHARLARAAARRCRWCSARCAPSRCRRSRR